MFFDKQCSKIVEECPQFSSVNEAFNWLINLQVLPEEEKIEKKFQIQEYQFAALLAVNPVINIEKPCKENMWGLFNEINHHAQLVCLTNSKDAVEVGESLGKLLIDKYRGFTLDTSRVTIDPRKIVGMYSHGTIMHGLPHPKWTKGFLPEKSNLSSFLTY